MDNSALNKAISDKIIGISIGTSNASMAIYDKNEYKIISLLDGSLNMPASVAITKTNGIITGYLAKGQSVLNPKNSYTSIINFVGKRECEISDKLKNFEYKIIFDELSKLKFNCPNLRKKLISPEQLLSHIFRSLIREATRSTREVYNKVVITIPDNFNDFQRLSLKNSAELAGLEVKDIINESTAALLTHDVIDREKSTSLIFDFGASKLSINIIESGIGTSALLANFCDDSLGGNDIDRIIINYMLESFKKKYNIDLSKDKEALQRIVTEAELAKIKLSSLQSTTLYLPHIYKDKAGNSKHLGCMLTRSDFEEMISPIINRCRAILQKILFDSKVLIHNIDNVIFVGGSVKIPSVKSMLLDILGKSDISDIDYDCVHALGASIQGLNIANRMQNLVPLYTVPLSLGISTFNGVFIPIIKRNTKVPVTQSRYFTTTNDNQTSIYINIVQGERKIANKNKYIGTFVATNLINEPKNVPIFQITFSLDFNDILTILVKELRTNITQKFTIEGSSNLTKTEIDKLIEEAKTNLYNDTLEKAKLENV